MHAFLDAFALSLAQTGAPSGPLSSVGENPMTIFESTFQSHIDVLNRPDELVAALNAVHPVWAGVFVALGAISLLNGWRWRRWVTLTLAALLGVGLGQALGDRVGDASVISAAFALLLAVAALPMMRFTVALFAGLAGAFAGANCWSAVGGDPTLHQFGAVIGFVGMGLLAFVAYHVVTVAFTAIGGAALLLMGGLSLLLHVPSWNGAIASGVTLNPQMTPLLAGVLALTGMIMQFVGAKGGVRAVTDAAEKRKPAHSTALSASQSKHATPAKAA